MNEPKKGYMGNPNLRRERQTYNYTPEELAEMLKCAQDIEYFAETYCEIITLGGKEKIKLYDYQRELLKTMQYGNPEEDKYNTIVLSPRQSGKCIVGQSQIKLKNKNTNEIMEVSIQEFFEMVKGDTNE